MSSDDDVFRALSNSTRRLILEELADNSEQTLHELQVRLTMNHDIDITRQGVSKHLEALEGAGLITSTRRGRQRVMEFAGVEQVQSAVTWLNRLAEEDIDTEQKRS